MKKINHYLAFCAVFALLLTGCSKEENSELQDPAASPESAVLTFGAVLNDLNNSRATSKAHFGQVPDCSDAEPALAVIEFSYGDVSKTVEVDILSDENGYFTDYSEELRIPVPSNSTTTVTLTGFRVYDGDTSGGSDDDPYFSDEYGNLIWIAPVESEEGQFDGYVDNPLDYEFEVSPGTKPYIDIEVLCFDRRMVNEYGYVFFDIEEKELIQFCVFGNFCPPSGRHYVASYSLNVWTVDNDGNNEVQIYTDLTREATLVNGEYQADPLCIVLPDDPNETDEYRIEITILDGDNYDATEEVIRTAILTDEEVRTFFDGDDNLEYFHFFEGCDQNDNPPIFDDPRDNKMTYKTCLKGINNSGAVALAAASLEGSTLEVSILAMNMATGMQHAQHIHGFTAEEPRMLAGGGTTTDAICPPESASGDDNIISVAEGAPFYGGIQLPLRMMDGDFPTPNGSGTYLYNRVFTLDESQKSALTALDEKVIVLHGVPGDAMRPVACGELMKVE
ncbi:hypothetical protein [Christiangramia sp.]|uniref:hypothetical protein n=1 Tax=Christiangramia sp. TaxID=1931228 RepID=UPI0026254444|nr:hypothetical protein [Christiangramia sp.]